MPELRRRLALAVSTVGALSMLVACGSAKGDSAATRNLAYAQLPPCPVDALAKAKKPVTIHLWVDQAVESSNNLKSLVEQFNRSQTDVKVALTLFPGLEDVNKAFAVQTGLASETATSTPSAAPPGEVATMVQLQSFRVRQMADSGVVLPAQSCINATKFDQSKIVPALRAYYSIGGVQWPAMMNAAMPLFLYNADHFKRAGLDPAKPPTTLAELESDALKLKAAGVSQRPVSLIVDASLVESWLTGVGVSLVSDGNGRVAPPQHATFNTGAAVELFTIIKRMISEGLVTLYPNDNNQIGHLVSLATGAASITFDYSTSATSVQAVVGGDSSAQSQAKQMQGGGGLGGTVTHDYRAAPIPGLQKAGQADVSGSAWYISRKASPEEQAAAWRFAAFMYERANQVSMLTKGSFLPATTEAASDPAVAKFWGSGLAGQWLNVANQQFTHLDPVLPGPLIGPYEDFVSTVTVAINELQDRPNMTPAQVVATAEEQLSRQLTAYNLAH